MALLVILVSALLSLTFNPYAAVLEVNYSGVAVQRIGTEEWKPLQPLSLAPVAKGDNIRTDSIGRATIHFDDIASVFIMQNVHITIDEFELSDTDNSANIELSVNGLSTYTIHKPELLNNFSLQIGDLVIHQPAHSFSVWRSDNNLISVIVNEGDLSLSDNGQVINIPAGHGYNQRRETIAEINFFPLNEATLLASIIQCRGIATAEDNQNLTVRTSASITGQVVGFIQNRAPVYIIGISADQQRVRVRYYSSFGWVETTGVTYQCDNLPTYDSANREAYYSILNPSEFEQQQTYPYFGSRIDDPYFYIYQDAPSGE